MDGRARARATEDDATGSRCVRCVRCVCACVRARDARDARSSWIDWMSSRSMDDGFDSLTRARQRFDCLGVDLVRGCGSRARAGGEVVRGAMRVDVGVCVRGVTRADGRCGALGGRG